MERSGDRVSRADYLEFFRTTLTDLEEDFPRRFLDQVRNQGLQSIHNSDNLGRWACVEAWMYAFTREDEYLQRARDLLLIVVGHIESTPRLLWIYTPPDDPETTAAILRVYASFPGSGWHIGGFSNHLGVGGCSLILERFGAWRDAAERLRVREAAAQLADYRLQKTSFYHFDDDQRNNRTLTSARGVFLIAQAFADHPEAARWRDWAVRQFRVNLNARSDEDASSYQSDWFHSILNIVEYLEEGEQQYFSPHHRAYFQHFRDLILPDGSCAAYGDSTGTNSAHLPILEKGASVFRDGTYKHAAAALFRRPMGDSATARQQLGSMRWIDAYRWADDDVEPAFPRMESTVTAEGTQILRLGDRTRHAYLSLTSNDQTSKTGAGHGHVDANAISRWTCDGVTFLEDGAYQWPDAIFHNRVLWRPGEPPGRSIDYFRPRKTRPHWDPKDQNRKIYARRGPSEGVEEGWHPDEAVDTRVELLVQRPHFTASRSALGAHRRTTVLDGSGRCVVFDSIDSEDPVAAVCLFHARTITQQGHGWVRVSADDAEHAALIISLEPGRLKTEPELRNNAHEHLVYAFARGCRPWFVTVLLPGTGHYDPDPGADGARELGMELRTIHDGSEQDAARVVRLPAGDRVTYIGCRRGRGGAPIEYVHGIRTDAMLLYVTEHRDGQLEVSAARATVVEHRGEELARADEPADFHLDGLDLDSAIVHR